MNLRYFSLLTLTILIHFNIESVVAQCHSNQSDSFWYVGSQYGSHKITTCHGQSVYNCHGFVLSYFEDNCQPGINSTIQAPYLCPSAQGILNTGAITTSSKFIEVCSSAGVDVVTYDIYGGDVHSAVKVTEGSTTKYISKYGSDGPLVSHDLSGSYYHYTTTVSSPKYWSYIGEIQGDATIVGTSSVSFNVLSKSGVTYSWSIIEGGSNIRISSATNQNSVTLSPLHSGSAILKLTVDSQCGDPQSQTINLSITTNICLEGTYTNAGSDPYNLNTGNSVSTGSVMTAVTCPNATSYTWQRTSGSLSYYASGANMSFTMVSGASVSFKITARNSSYQVIGTRNVSYYNYGSYMVYPNPVNSTFDIDVVDDLELDIVIYDENMNLKKQIKGYKAKSGINVIDWQDGDYVIHIYQGKNRVREQKIKVLN